MSNLTLENIHFIPSIHQRMAFADEVRRAAEEVRPDCIAVELHPALKSRITRGVMRLPQISAVCWPNAEGSGRMFYIPMDPCDSMIEGVRIGIEREIEIEFIDGGYEPDRDQPDSTDQFSLPDDTMIAKTRLERYVKTALPFLARIPAGNLKGFRPIRIEEEREAFMAARLAELSKQHERILCVLGLNHYARVRHLTGELIAGRAPMPKSAAPGREPAGVFLSHVGKSSIKHLLREIPCLAAEREQIRETAELTGDLRFDKLAALVEALREAEGIWREKYKSEIGITRFKAMLQFTRNLALAEGRLEPGGYETIIGAKSCVDGDYGYEAWNIINDYPPQEDENEMPRLDLRHGSGGLRGGFSDRDEKFRMEPLFGEDEREMVRIPFRRRPTFEQMESWKEQWNREFMGGICSWPPEDELQEKFMTFVRKRALQIVSEDKKQVVEFTTSILDGLDIRETMRNWHTGKLFVQQTPQPQGQVGAVVVIFDDPANDKFYPWRVTLYAENQNESDIAFYATPLGVEVVGPRITRTEFGGILSIYPARRIPDIWSYPGAETIKTCSEVLMAGAALMAERRFIAYVAARPPTSFMREIASRMGKRIIYLPMRGFAESQLKKIRKFHILGGHDVRDYAGDYLFE